MSYKDKYNNCRNYGSDPTKYVKITSSDFNTPLLMTAIAQRIASDECFDRYCQRLAKTTFRKQEVT